MPIQAGIQVHGLKELASSLRALDRDLARELQQTNKAIAEEVAEVVRAKVPKKTGRAAGTVRARATAQRASLVGGGARAPYYPWLDFGGSVGRGHRPGIANSGSVKRQRIKRGRFILPTVDEHADVEEYVQVLNELLRRHGLAGGDHG